MWAAPCRRDRVARNGQMGALAPDVAPDRVVLIGEPTRSARSAIPSDWPGPVTDLGGRRRPEELLAQLRTLAAGQPPGRVTP